MDESHFRAKYDADAANQARQSWKEYWEWVRVFYEGKRFPPVPGWAPREKDLAAKFASDPALVEELRRVGRMLAAEWAKDNAVRKVSTSDLQTWGRRFSDAGSDAAAMRKALADVVGAVEARLKA